MLELVLQIIGEAGSNIYFQLCHQPDWYVSDLTIICIQCGLVMLGYYILFSHGIFYLWSKTLKD